MVWRRSIKHGQSFTVESRSTVLANGGAGGLWLHTSNPAGATADGFALAWQAGAALTDLEFMQFHPTVLVVDGTSHLISEAVRGEGAYLRNHAGERFMLRYAAQAELAPRDVVARAILSEMLAEETDCQYLDLRHLPAEKMHARFPTISAICRSYGLDLASDLLPIAPAAHYCMGGVMVDTDGRTTVARPVCRWRSCLYWRAWRESVGQQLAARRLVFGLRVRRTESNHCGYESQQLHATLFCVSLSDEQYFVPETLIVCYDEMMLTMRREVRRSCGNMSRLRRDQSGLLEA